MLKKIDIGASEIEYIETLNSIVDAVNSLRDDCNLLMGYIAPEDGGEPTVAKNANVDENVQDKFAEQRKWIGKLCFFWGDNKEDTCYGILGDIIEYSDAPFEAKDYALWYKHCEPVKPTDSIIYKGGDNG